MQIITRTMRIRGSGDVISPARRRSPAIVRTRRPIVEQNGREGGRVLSPKIQPGGGRDVAARMRNLFFDRHPAAATQNARARALPVSNKKDINMKRIVIGMTGATGARSLFELFSSFIISRAEQRDGSSGFSSSSKP